MRLWPSPGSISLHAVAEQRTPFACATPLLLATPSETVSAQKPQSCQDWSPALMMSAESELPSVGSGGLRVFSWDVCRDNRA